MKVTNMSVKQFVVRFPLTAIKPLLQETAGYKEENEIIHVG